MQQSAALESRSSASVEPQFLPRIVSLLESIRKELDTDRENARILVARATSLLRVEIGRQASNEQGQQTNGGLAGWQVRRLQSFIEVRLEKPIHLEDLSVITKLSTSHFCRAFKRTFNETPHSYIVGLRLTKAGTLMLASDLPLSEIDMLCGFGDQAHFSKLFRQQYRQSPAAWRRERTDSRGRNNRYANGKSQTKD